MKIGHIALWTSNLERLKEFYIKYFNAQASNIYINEKTGFKSYFLQFDDACRLELMEKQSIYEQNKAGVEVLGLAHFSISVGSKKMVDDLTNRIRDDSFMILSEPRTTGDGYYESVIADPDGNKVEITI